MYIGDKENSNADSALVSTRRSLIFNRAQQAALYQKFFHDGRGASGVSHDGYIYIHDMSARRDTMNCCLFDVDEPFCAAALRWAIIWYNEPKTLNVAFDVIGDIVLSAPPASSTAALRCPCVDQLLATSMRRSQLCHVLSHRYIDSLGLSDERAQRRSDEGHASMTLSRASRAGNTSLTPSHPAAAIIPLSP